MLIDIYNCRLEVDTEKGVLSIVNSIGSTLVTVLGMPTEVPDPTQQPLKINVQEGIKYFNWKNNRRGR